jgi:indolepyruvate ferredoxin oxidoreductase
MGKFNETEGDYSGGEWSMPNPSAHTLLRANADLSPVLIARAIAQRLKKLGIDADTTVRIDTQLALLAAKESSLQVTELSADRTPWFCSGCPHNTSTQVPEGSRAMAGIGCHYMATWMDRATIGFTQMGGEGVPWVGQQPFSTESHVFANIGDGTYFHSGLLAIRQAIAAGVNITYKVLYNDAVAMTGGQAVGERPEGHTVPQIVGSLLAEGVSRLVVVTDEPAKYARNVDARHGLPAGIEVFHRDELDRLQREFREIAGTSVIVYDQTCATEKRRRRKRGTLQDPAVRVLINDLVCEGCGDCSVQSNCLSVEPLETPLGRKRTINQSTCNKDTRCLKGFCPSFVTVEGGRLKKPARAQAPSPFELGELPEPVLPALTDAAYGIVVAGVGGTGVITIGQLLGMAAHLEGRGIVTQDAAGLAQKGGATWSHVLVGARADQIHTTRVSMAAADLVLGCDPLVTAGRETLLRMREGRTRVALNLHGAPTATFVHQPDWSNPSEACTGAIARAVGAQALGSFDASRVATRFMGDSLYANPMLLGFAWQKGWIPLGLPALLRAIELNAVAIEANKAAFTWGRWAAHDPARLERLLAPSQVVELRPRETLENLIARRVEFLTAYQNAAYAQAYRDTVERVRSAEAPLGRTALAEAVARYLFKLMAYKDEYEVARLHTQTGFRESIAAQFEGDYRIHHHLAPPLFSRRNAQGELQKRRFGAAMGWGLGLLAHLRGLRGTALDVFGYTEERRSERALIVEYRRCIDELLTGLTPGNHALAAEIARIPEQIRGYGHVKARHLEAARTRWDALMARWRGHSPADQLAA